MSYYKSWLSESNATGITLFGNGTTTTVNTKSNKAAKTLSVIANVSADNTLKFGINADNTNATIIAMDNVVIKFNGPAEEYACGIEDIANAYAAEAEGIKAKGLAEAEGIDKKAEAQKKMGEASVLEMYFQAMPLIAQAVAAPLANVDSITMYGEGNQAKMVSDITTSMNQIMAGVKDATGVDPMALIAGFMGGKIANNE
jgi:flotillin